MFHEVVAAQDEHLTGIHFADQVLIGRKWRGIEYECLTSNDKPNSLHYWAGQHIFEKEDRTEVLSIDANGDVFVSGALEASSVGINGPAGSTYTLFVRPFSGIIAARFETTIGTYCQIELANASDSGNAPRLASNSSGLDFFTGGSTPALGMSVYESQIDIYSPIRIAERAAPAADFAGWGQLWVKDTTPNELWFTNDAGTSFQLGGGSGPEVLAYSKPADTARSYDTGYTADPHLITDTLEANSLYKITILFVFTANGTAKFNFRLQKDSGLSDASLSWTYNLSSLSASALTFNDAIACNATGITNNRITTVEGLIVTGSNPGVLAVGWGQSVSHVDPTTLKAGTNMILTKLS